MPTPIDFMHQLSGRLPEDKLLDGPELTSHVMKLVDQGRTATPK